MILEEYFDEFLAHVFQVATVSREPSVKMGEQADMRNERVGPVALILEQRDVVLDMRTERAAAQRLDSFGWNE